VQQWIQGKSHPIQVEEATMSTTQKAGSTCDRSAVSSLVIGVIGAILTGLVHYSIMTSSHFDFLVRDVEFFLVLGTILVIAALSLADIRAGLYAIHHMNEPHGKLAKALALTGITLGIADTLPALIILTIMFETFLLRFMQIKNIFEY
jgi:hypothetical protein